MGGGEQLILLIQVTSGFHSLSSPKPQQRILWAHNLQYKTIFEAIRVLLTAQAPEIELERLTTRQNNNMQHHHHLVWAT